MHKKNKANKLSNILSNLPLHHKLHQQLSTSEKIITVLQPKWKKWCVEHLGKPLNKGCSLSYFDDGTLLINCQSVVAATKLKHLKRTLLLFFQQTLEQNTKGSTQKFLEKITDVSIIHQPPTQQPTRTVQEQATNDSKKAFSQPKRAVSANAINAIESCQKNSKNSELKNSLERLKNTLKYYKP